MSATRTCGPCTRASENKHWDCPPRMADGRLFTDYRPRCDIDLQYVGDPVATNSYAYRQFLIRNADGVMAAHREQAFSASWCGPCVQPYDVGTMLPEADKFVCNASTCDRVPGVAGGLGTGRAYGSTPEERAAHAAFLAQQERLQARAARTANCCAAPPRQAAPEGHRPSVPGGAVPAGFAGSK